jgi:hypothetical protein
LEGLGLVMIYFLRGKKKFPWEVEKHFPQINAVHPDAYNLRLERLADMKRHKEHLRDIKRKTSIEDMCAGLPTFMLEFMQYVRSLEFEEEPQYS